MQAQGSRDSGLLKGCLIVAVVFIGGCIGLSILSSLFGMAANEPPQEEDSSLHMELAPPPGQVAYGGAQGTPHPGTDDEPEDPFVMAPGCYVVDAILESAADGNGAPAEPWTFADSRRSDQGSVSQRPPAGAERPGRKSWPRPGPMKGRRSSRLKYFPAQSSPEEPNMLFRVVRAHTHVSAAPH